MDAPPEVIDYPALLARTAGGPGAASVAAYGRTAGAPGAASVAGYARTAAAQPDLDYNAAKAPTTTPPQLAILDPEDPLIPNMPAVFQPAFIELVGAGSLSSLNAAPGDVGQILQGVVNGELKAYQVREGTEEQALPGIVHPVNFDAETNAIVFIQC